MHFVIAGLSNTGKSLAELLAKEGNDVVVVDRSEDRCNEMATSSDVMCMTGDATKKSVLEEAGVKNANAVVAVTGDDSDNLMISMLAKEMGARKVISLVDDAVHAEAFRQAGISFLVKPDAVVAKHISRMVSQPYVKDFLSSERAEIFEIECEEGMKCIGERVSEIGATNGMKVLVLEREGKYLNEDAKIEPKDWLTLIVGRESTKKGVEFMNKWFAKE
jgi:trk system potassium uptake protein TrkA